MTSSIESNNLHATQNASIHVNRVTQWPPRPMWLWHRWQMVYSLFDHANREHLSGFNSEMRFLMVASIMPGLPRRFLSLIDTHHTSSLIYRLCWKPLNEAKMPFNDSLSILSKEKKLQTCGNLSSRWLTAAIRTRPHPEMHHPISWWLMRSPPCGPSATIHMNCLLVAFKRRHCNDCWVVSDVCCIIQTTEILILIAIVCEVSKSYATPSNVIL